MTTPAVLSASTLEGDKVVTPDGDDVGKVKEIMLDVVTGGIAYAVIARGGALGIGEKLFAVPWRLIAVDGDNEQLVLDVDPEVLDNSPGFDPDNWPQFSDRSWGEEIHRYYDISPYWEDPVPPLT